MNLYPLHIFLLKLPDSKSAKMIFCFLLMSMSAHLLLSLKLSPIVRLLLTCQMLLFQSFTAQLVVFLPADYHALTYKYKSQVVSLLHSLPFTISSPWLYPQVFFFSLSYYSLILFFFLSCLLLISYLVISGPMLPT